MVVVVVVVAVRQRYKGKHIILEIISIFLSILYVLYFFLKVIYYLTIEKNYIWHGLV